MESEIKNNTKKYVIITIVGVIIVALMTFCLIYYFSHKANLGVDIPIGDINKPVVESQNEGRNLQKEILELNKTYGDAIAWLKIPGTSIDMPIFKTGDNNRYLRNDRDNKKTKWGETFMDYRCNIDNITNKSHFIIYGHNTETDDHFTPLLNYKTKDFFSKHQIIEMSTITNNYKWQIFTTYVTDINFFYIDTNFNTSNEYTDYLSTVKGKSMYNTDINVDGNDTILTLSTCDYTLKDGRFVVQAKLVK